MDEESLDTLTFTVMFYGDRDERPWLVSCEACGWSQEGEGRRSEIRPAVEAHGHDEHPDSTIPDAFLNWLDGAAP